jgi:hypothetical protein
LQHFEKRSILRPKNSRIALRTHSGRIILGGFMKVIVTSLFLAGTFMLIVPSLSSAQPPKKGKLNTNLYENESTDTSITGKIKAVREVQEEMEVFIDNPKGNSGPYVLPQNIKNRAGLIKLLNKSQKAGGPAVTISIDEQQRIKSVEESEGSAKTLDWGS